MARPPESKVYQFQLHRVTLWTVGCGLLCVGGMVFLAGSLVGAWWVSRPAPVASTEVPGTSASASADVYQEVPGTSASAYQEVPGTASTETAEAPGTSTNPAAGLVQGPAATAPAVTGPAVRGPTVSRSGIQGPTVTGPRTSGPRVQGPRVRSPTSGTLGGGRAGGQTVRLSDAGQASTAPGTEAPVAAAATGTPTDGAIQIAPNGGEVGEVIDGALQDLALDETSPPAPVYQYAVQVGLFTQNDDAKAMMESLTELGYETYVQTIRSQKRRVIVRSVRLGPWATQEDAEEAALHYRTDTGQGAAVVREAVEASEDG